MKQMERTPFLRLIIPLIIGIFCQYYLLIHKWSNILLLLAVGIMLLSYFIPKKLQFGLRWLYGCGLFCLLFSIGVVSTEIRQQLSAYTFADISKSHKGIITDIPQEKPNTIALNLNIKEFNKKIICYLPKNKQTEKLRTGDQILFFSKIEPFKKTPTQNSFSYANYVYNKGFSGYTFVTSDRWILLNQKSNNIFIKAVQCREKILNIYQNLNLTKDEFAILSALTLGYKDALSDNLQESFRTTGTSHLLAISGMHVGIIYLIIVSLVKTIPFNKKHWCLSSIFIIILLWGYVFVIGFPPSAIRACSMLSVFCISQSRRTKTSSLNTLLCVAFFMLLWNPFWLFDLGFQLSFTAVLSMLILLPIFSSKIYFNNKIIRYFWNIFLASIVVQIGTFPLCLYYFGMFPTYFFLTNLFAIPLVSLIICSAISILATTALGWSIPSIQEYITFIPITIYKLLVSITTEVIYFFEKAPFAQIEDLNINLIRLILIWTGSTSLIYFILRKKAWSLNITLISILIFVSTLISQKIELRNSINIDNRQKENHITYYRNYRKVTITNSTENKILFLNGIKYLIVTNDSWKTKYSTRKFNIDYLHIVGNNCVSIHSLNQNFKIKKVILDSSLSNKDLKRFVFECEKLRIPYYDVSKNGFLRIFF